MVAQGFRESWMRARGALSSWVSERPEKREAEGPRVNQTQIQESLHRFMGVFWDRILQAAEPLMSPTAPPKVRTVAMRQILLYASSSMDIATGRFPEISLTDMIVFMDLCHGVIEDYWLPEVFGERGGRALEVAFKKSGDDLDRLAEGIMTPQQIADVHRLVQGWRRENPGQRRVEHFRPFSYAALAGRTETDREREARGIVRSVRAAIESADEALLMGERAIFLTHRLPFLLRFQARLGLQELIQDGLATLGVDDALAHVKELQPLIGDASTLAARADQAANDSRALLETLRPLLQPRGRGEELRAERLVASANRLAAEAHADLRELDGLERVLASANRLTDKATEWLQTVRAEGHRGLIYFAVLVAVLMSLFWAGYVVAHRLTRDGDRDRPAPRGSAADPGHA
jgi:hypothetical protein